MWQGIIKVGSLNLSPSPWCLVLFDLRPQVKTLQKKTHIDLAGWEMNLAPQSMAWVFPAGIPWRVGVPSQEDNNPALEWGLVRTACQAYSTGWFCFSPVCFSKRNFPRWYCWTPWTPPRLHRTASSDLFSNVPDQQYFLLSCTFSQRPLEPLFSHL